METKVKKVILFVGETGSGKSSTINTILKESRVEIGNKPWSCTTERRCEVINDGDYEIRLWDTPGLGDSPPETRNEIETHEICDSIAKIANSEGQIDIIFLVFNGKISDNLKLCYLILTTILFDKNICKNLILLRTNYTGLDSDNCDRGRQGVRGMDAIKKGMPHFTTGDIFFVDNKEDPQASRDILLSAIKKNRQRYDVPNTYEEMIESATSENLELAKLNTKQKAQAKKLKEDLEEAERKRAAAEDKGVQDAKEIKRLNDEREKREKELEVRLQKEEENNAKIKKISDDNDATLKALREQTERLRLVELERKVEQEIQRVAEQKRLAEQERQKLAEKAKKKLAEERKQLAEQEKKRLAEQEKQRLEQKEKQRLAEQERQRMVEQERQRLADKEKQRVAAEQEKQRVAELERQRLAEQEKQRLAEQEKQRLAELERQRLAEQFRQRVAEQERKLDQEKQKLEREQQRLAEEEQRRQQRLAEEEQRRIMDIFNSRPYSPPYPGPRRSGGGYCGAPTQRGGSCRNPRGSCPHH